MTLILRYIAPNTQCVNGKPRPEHHFFLDASEFEQHREIADWLDYNTKPQARQYWPETVAVTPTTSVVQFHVILHKDRDALLFKMRW